MAITGNIRNFFHDVREATGKAVGALPKECGRISLIGKRIVTVLDTTCRIAIKHYPKTVLVALIVSSVAAVLLLPFSLGLFVLGANCFFLYNHGRRLFGVIQIYNRLDISEWTGTEEEQRQFTNFPVFRKLIEGNSEVFQFSTSFFRPLIFQE